MAAKIWQVASEEKDLKKRNDFFRKKMFESEEKLLRLVARTSDSSGGVSRSGASWRTNEAERRNHG